MINVCFSLHDRTGRYSKFIGTAMLSIFDNTNSEVTVHIFHDNTLTVENRDKFFYLAGKYNQHVKFYNVEKLCADKIAEYVKLVPSVVEARVSKAAFFRLLIPYIFPEYIEKVIYLDADIIVNLDIKELWKIDLGESPLGVVPEMLNSMYFIKVARLYKDGFVKATDYFNSGVLLMNLKVWRAEEQNILAGIKFRGEHPEYTLFDQEILNYCFATRALKLPVKFNRFARDARTDKEFTIEQKIYHYAGGNSGLGLNVADPFNRLWFSYFIRTPWLNVDTFSTPLKSDKQMEIDRKNLLMNFSDALAGRARAFVVDEEHLHWIKEKFSIRDDEDIYVIDKEDEESVNKLIEIMKTEHEKKVFFTAIHSFAHILEKAGFVQGKDLFNTLTFNMPKWKRQQEFNNHKILLEM